MPFSRTLLACAAMAAALGGCTTTEAPPAAAVVETGPYAGRSVLDVAIEAAGGEAAIGKVKEIYFTGAAKVTVDGAAVEQNVAIVVRPFSFYRSTNWAKGAQPKTAKTTQAELGQAWDVNRVTWQPMAAPAAKFENEQLGLYSLMLLAPLKAQGATVREQPVGADGTRAIQVTHPGAPGAELEFDASGKLVRAGYSGTDPKTGAATATIATFSGEIISNGVKWPRHIKIERNGSPAFEIEIATFEALPAHAVRPLDQAMQYEGGQNNAGEEDAG